MPAKIFVHQSWDDDLIGVSCWNNVNNVISDDDDAGGDTDSGSSVKNQIYLLTLTITDHTEAETRI